jgi:colicin import membrane protein
MSTYPEPGLLASGVLAIAVHLLLVLLLVFGISWQQRRPDPVIAELWQEIAPPKPQPIVAPVPEPSPPPPAPKAQALPPEPKPEPPKPAPVPKAQPSAQPSKADIELKDKRRRLREQKLAEEALRQEEVRKKAEARKEQEALHREEQRRQEELKRQEEARRKEEDKRQEDVRRDDERRMEKEAETRRSAILDEQQKLAQGAKIHAEEEARKHAVAEAAAARQKQLGQYMDRIRQKIRGRLALPPGINGNPEAVYRVTLLPGGEVLDITLVKTSGMPAYDAAVERAIRAADPLPVPSDPELFQLLRELPYKFRPLE